ncbi:MAG: fibronectin type III domain-containing protein [Bacteroidales bacterium]|nr:fibronectin type III domain-containing protein [Bacteroidales bacterium]
MKKSINLLLLLAAMLLPMTMRAQGTLLVADGTSTSSYVPFYGLWADEDQHEQIIYSSSLLGDMIGNSISSVTFFASSTSTALSSGSFVISLGTTTETSFSSSYLPTTDFEEVYSGQLSYTGTQLIIEFETPFTYSGGNLVIDIDFTSFGDYNSCDWFGENQSGNVSAYAYGGDSPTTSSFLPKTEFAYSAAGSSICRKPRNIVVSDLASDGATLTWTGHEDHTGYTLMYHTADFDPATSEDALSVTTTDTTYTFSGLDASTTYYVKVKADCSDGGESGWVAVSFRTTGIPYTDGFPYMTGFEEDDDTGWEFANGSNGWFIDTAAHNTGSYALYVSNDNGASNSYNITSTTNSYAYRYIQFDQAGDYILSFDWRAMGEGTSTRYDYMIAYLASSNADFEASTISTTGWNNLTGYLNMQSEWQTFSTIFSITTPGLYPMVFLWHNDGSVGTQPPAAIDNVVINPLSCPAPINLAISNITSDGADISWTAVGTENEWAVKIGDNDWETASDTIFSAVGLDPNTVYNVIVKAVCGDGDTSLTISGSFRTACDGYTPIPYTEGFEGYETGELPGCWQAVATGENGGTVFPSVYNYSSNTRNGDGYFEFEASSSSSAVEIAALPPMENINTLRLSMWISSSSTYPCSIEVGVLEEDGSFTVVDSLELITFSGGSNWSSNYHEYITFFNEYEGTGDRIAIRATRTGSGQYTLFVDDLSVTMSGAAEITNMPARATANLGDDLTITATVGGDQSSMSYSWSSLMANAGTATMTPADNVLTINYTAEGYDTVTLIVSNSFGADTAITVVHAIDLNPVENYPYSTSFEDGEDTSWVFVNGINGWFIDTAVHNTGSRAMYISNDTGANNNYSHSSCVSYAYRVFNISQTGDYAVSFDWKGNGESSYDYLRAWIAPASAEFTANYLPDGSTYMYSYTTSTPSGWIDLGGKMNLQNSWQTVQSIFAINQAGLYNLVFMWGNDGGAGTQPPAAVDNIILTPLSCPAPTALAVDTIEPTSITVHWTAGEETQWVLSVNGNMIDNVTTNPYTITGLDQYTYYDIAVYAICGDGDTSFASSTIHVRTTYSCPWPTGLTLDSVSDSEMAFHWVPGGEESSWEVTVGDEAPVVVNDTTYSMTGLNSNTLYNVRVRAICGAGDTSVATTANFRTACGAVALPWEENFDNITNISDLSCWERYNGFYVDSTNTGLNLTSTTSGWLRYTTGMGGSSHIKLNIYGTTAKYWIVTPSMAITESAELSFDYSLTAYASTGAASTNCPDDRFVVLITADNGATWTPLAKWGSDSTRDDYAYTSITNSVQSIAFPITGYDGQTIRIAFYGESTVTGGDNDLHIDNIMITSSTCPRPTSVTAVATSATEIDVTISGDDAANYRVYWTDGTTTDSATVTGLTYTITGLTGATLYDISVVTICDDGSITMPATTSARTECANGGCDLVINMNDSYGDGWNGNAIIGYVNGAETFSATLDDDETGSFTYSLCESDNVVLIWSEGSYPDEASFEVLVGGNPLANGDGDNLTDNDTIISFTGCPSCSTPQNIVVDNITSSSATISWTPSGDESEWEITINGVSAIVSTPTYSTINLSAMTNYNVAIRAICGGGDTSFAALSNFTSSMCDNAITMENFDTTMNTTTSSYTPIGYSLYNYSYVQIIIPASSMDANGTEITALSFLPTSTTSSNYFTNMDVYMANVSENEFTDFIHPDSAHTFVQVISNGNFNFDGTTWQTHAFDTPFTWDGQSNVLVAINRRHGSWSSSSSFAAHTDTLYRAIYDYTDNGAFDINTAEDGNTTHTVGNLRLISCGEGCAAPIMGNVVVTSEDVTVNFNADGTVEAAIVEGDNFTATSGTVVTGNTHTFANLTPATTYTFGLRNLCENGSASMWVTRTVTTDSAVCFVPTNVTVSATTFDGATITWTAGGEETAWEVRVYNNTYDQTFNANTNSLTVTGLNEGTFNVSVRALCSATNTSEWSEPIQFTTESCLAPTGVTVSGITANSATVSWPAVATSNGRYTMEYGFSGFSRGQGTTVEVTGTTYTITGLESEAEYDVYVASYCGENIVSPWSTVTSFTTIGGQETYTITVQSNNTAWGTVTGGGTYPAGTQVTLTATATAIGEFVEWQDGNTEAQRSIVVTGNATYTATFREYVGIDDVDGNAIALYPNPASTTVTIAGMELQSQIVIVDMNGREVYRANAADGSVKVDVSNLSKGAYFVRITGEKTNAIRKLVVK